MLFWSRYGVRRVPVHPLVARAAVCLWIVAACGEAAPSREPLRTVRSGPPAASAAPRRVVSLYPSATEIVLALGGADRLVARTDFDRDPRLGHLPSLGWTLTPELEAVVALRPDLVIVSSITSSGVSSVEKLSQLGMPLVVAEIQTIPDLLAWIRRIGAELGVPARGDTVAAELQAELRSIRRRYAGCRSLTALYVLWPDPPRTAGRGTYVDEVIEAAGAANAFADVSQPWPEVSLEEIVRRDPDFLILPAAPKGAPLDRATLAARPGWRELRAVREGRVFPVEGDLFNRPGPRVAEAARTLGQRLDEAVEGRCRA